MGFYLGRFLDDTQDYGSLQVPTTMRAHQLVTYNPSTGTTVSHAQMTTNVYMLHQQM